jgi:hypothetical protein
MSTDSSTVLTPSTTRAPSIEYLALLAVQLRQAGLSVSAAAQQIVDEHVPLDDLDVEGAMADWTKWSNLAAAAGAPVNPDGSPEKDIRALMARVRGAYVAAIIYHLSGRGWPRGQFDNATVPLLAIRVAQLIRRNTPRNEAPKISLVDAVCHVVDRAMPQPEAGKTDTVPWEVLGERVEVERLEGEDLATFAERVREAFKARITNAIETEKQFGSVRMWLARPKLEPAPKSEPEPAADIPPSFDELCRLVEVFKTGNPGMTTSEAITQVLKLAFAMPNADARDLGPWLELLSSYLGKETPVQAIARLVVDSVIRPKLTRHFAAQPAPAAAKPVPRPPRKRV